MRVLAGFVTLLLLACPAQAGPKVIASIVPVHSIVAAVMGDTGTPELLLSGQMSEHRASFTAAQVADLGKADLVFIIGHGLEAKLAQMSGSEAVNGKAFVALSEVPGIKTLPVRQGGAFEAHHHDDHDDHDADGDHEEEAQHGEEEHAEGVLDFDPHVWLDPENAKAMAAAIGTDLAALDPANAAVYASNAKAFAARLDALSAEIAARLAPARGKPFIVFHDAYQYFENRFGLDAAGSISDIAATQPSAARLKEMRDKLKSTGAVCVFREPQFDDRYVVAVTEGSEARSGVLDGLGAGLTPGPGAYAEILSNLAASLSSCLAG